jgi:hypothetical protein
MATPLPPPPSTALSSTLADRNGGRIALFPLTAGTGSATAITSSASRRRFLTQLAAAVLLSVALLWVDVRQFVGRRGGVRESDGFGGGIGSVVSRRGHDAPMLAHPESDIDDESISRDALAFVVRSTMDWQGATATFAICLRDVHYRPPTQPRFVPHSRCQGRTSTTARALASTGSFAGSGSCTRSGTWCWRHESSTPALFSFSTRSLGEGPPKPPRGRR